jgi:hypothetical protein
MCSPDLISLDFVMSLVVGECGGIVSTAHARQRHVNDKNYDDLAENW